MFYLIISFSSLVYFILTHGNPQLVNHQNARACVCCMCAGHGSLYFPLPTVFWDLSGVITLLQ